ncbi:MAG: type I-C CRISPR-associated protein Cas5c [Oscillospiraceae bacterium]|jgi:CRISPR-associated protein Cas5d|nr:type I-C CRISPR-associated protein Cas5c [Oscillospiraceae bacterium]
MNYGFRVEVWGEYACFTRPELKVERVSYDVITPSAARGILEAVFWKPAIRYVIDEIAVCAPIRFENIRRNEINAVVVSDRPIAATDERAQRATLLLRGVRYVITAHFEPTDRLGDRDILPDGSFNHGKFADEIRRCLRMGKNFHTPYLGTREFPAKVRLLEAGDTPPAPIAETRSLGLMLYDIEYLKDPAVRFRPQYFMAQMDQGVIDLRKAVILQ